MPTDISIIVPTYNRQDKLAECLKSLIHQDYPQDAFEVIIIDDAASDETRSLIDRFRPRHPNLRYFSQPGFGPAKGRNLGVTNSCSAIVGFIDDDCTAHPGWVRAMVETHRSNPDIAAVGGLTLASNQKTPVMVSQFLSTFSIETSIKGNKEVIFFPTCNVSLKRWVFDKYKFDERFPLPGGEDLEFFWRLFKGGHRFIWDKKIKVIHYRDENMRSFMKQAYIYGRGNLLVKRIHKDHPLLKELSTGKVSFWFATIINVLKIPRFSCLLGNGLVSLQGQADLYKRSRIYAYLALHKIIYLAGNVSEYFRTHNFIDPDLPGDFKETVPLNDRPEFIILDITHRCNLKCNICEIRSDRPIKEFATNEVKSLIAQAYDWGVKEFVLSGGEPLIREDIFEILDYVKEKKYHTGILTNGILLDDKFIGRLSPYLTSRALSLSISLDALTPEIHDDIRGGKGCFEKTIKGLKKLAYLKKTDPGINFNVISIILNENLEELLSLAGFLKSLNVNSIQFQPLLSNNLIMKQRSSKVKYWIPKERLAVLDQVIDDLIEFKNKNVSLLRNSVNNLALAKKYFRGNLAPQDVRCLYAERTMLIANNGEVTTCYGSYGNVRKDYLKNIFDSKESRQAMARVKACGNPCLLPCFCD